VKSIYAFDAAAAVQKPAGTTDDRSQTFRAVEGGTQLQSGEKLLVEAYAAIWVILFAMILLSWRRQKQIDRRIDVLEGALEKARAGFDKGSS
jgi:CcmD family protein